MAAGGGGATPGADSDRWINGPVGLYDDEHKDPKTRAVLAAMAGGLGIRVLTGIDKAHLCHYLDSDTEEERWMATISCLDRDPSYVYSHKHRKGTAVIQVSSSEEARVEIYHASTFLEGYYRVYSYKTILIPLEFAPLGTLELKKGEMRHLYPEVGSTPTP